MDHTKIKYKYTILSNCNTFTNISVQVPHFPTHNYATVFGINLKENCRVFRLRYKYEHTYRISIAIRYCTQPINNNTTYVVI